MNASVPTQEFPTVPNHTIDPVTGFTESLAYASAFTGERKQAFLKRFYENGLALYDTCDELSLSHHTVNTAYKTDPVFREKFDECRARYTDSLEGTSRRNARDPKFYVERIFQLRSLKPEMYADQKSSNSPQITINVEGNILIDAKNRNEMIDAKIIQEAELVRKESEKESARIEEATDRPTIT